MREPEASSSYRASVEEPLVKKSLAEVYEEQFQKAQEGVRCFDFSLLGSLKS